MAIIGTAHVQIRADDKYFEADVRRATAKIKNVTIKLQADVDMAKASKKIRDLRYRITSKDAVLKVDANVDKAEAKMAKLLSKFLTNDVQFNAVANTAGANTALKEIQDRYSAKRIPFTAQADTKAASAALRSLSRMRTANIRAMIDPASQKALTGLFNTLTGTISGAKIKAVIAGVAGNFEGLAVKATMATAAVLALGGALLTTSANIFSIAGDITQAVGLLALAPTAIASMVAVITTAKMAFTGFGAAFSKDAKKAAEALAKLPPEAQAAVKGLKGVYTQIQKPVQNAFWKVMGTSLQDTVKTLLPSLISGLSNVGRGFAAVTKEVLGGFERMGDGTLQRMLDNLGIGLKNMAPGFGALTDAFAILGETGSTYLPQFGTWVKELGTDFKNFIVDAEKTGKIKIWIEEGVQSLQEMGSIVKSTAGFFSGLTTAARLAGAPGLTEMAESMRNIRDIVNGEPFQSRLVTVLEGARSGVEKMNAGFKNLTTFIGESSVALGIFFDEAGEIAGLTFDGIRSLFDGTGLGNGLYQALGGLKQFMIDMQPGFADLGSTIGSLGRIADEMFRNLAPGLLQLFETLEGVIKGIEQGVIDAMPVFNEFIQALLELAQGPIVALAEGVGNLLTAFSKLPDGIQTILMSLGLFALAFSVVGKKWGAFTGGIRKSMADADSSVGRNLRNMQSGFRDMGGAFRNVSQEAADRGVRSFNGFGSSVRDTMRTTADGMRKNVGTAFNAMPASAQRAASGIRNAFATFGAGFISGANLNRELDTVRDGFARLPESARTAGRNIRTSFQTAFARFGDLVAPANSAVRTMATQMHANLAPARTAFTNLTQHAATATRNAATQIGTGLRSAMSGLTGFLGGPWGIAIMAATVVLGEFATQQSKAKGQVDNLASAFESSGGRMDAGVRKMIGLNLDLKESFYWMEFDSGFDIAKKVGVPLKDVADAAAGVPGAMERVQTSLEQSGNAASDFGTLFNRVIDSLKDTPVIGGIFDVLDRFGLFQTEGDKLNNVIDEQRRVTEAALQANRDQAEAMGVGTAASARLSENYDTLRDSASSVSSRVEALKDNLEILNTTMDTGHRASRDHAENMFKMEDAMKTLHGATEGTISANGRMNDSFRNTLLNADNTFSTANRGAIDFSKEMDAAATSILTLGMEEMKKLQDAGASLPAAQAGAMKVMDTATDGLRAKLGKLGFDAGEVNSIIGQLKLNPDQLTGALVVDTKAAEAEVMRFELFKEAILAGNWEVALTASTDQVKEAILSTDEYKKAYTEGGWEAVVKLKDSTGKGFSELMTKIALAKDESEVTALLKAEFSDAHVFDSAKKAAEEYGQTEVNAVLGVTDNASIPAGIARDAVVRFNEEQPLDKYLKGVDWTGTAVESAKTNLGSVPDVEAFLTAADGTAPGTEQAQVTMNGLQDVARFLFSKDKAKAGLDAAQGTMNSLQNVSRWLQAVNKAGSGKEAAQATIDLLRGKEVTLSADDQASGVVDGVNNKKLNDKSFNIIGVLSGVSDAVRRALGFANGGIVNGLGIQTFANGGIQKSVTAPAVTAYANGGFENHIAQIARPQAGRVRIWGEEETGGEAYIPLSKAKRPRSEKILEEVARIFGMTLLKTSSFANGAVVGGSSSSSSSSSVSSSSGNVPAALLSSISQSLLKDNGGLNSIGENIVDGIVGGVNNSRGAAVTAMKILSGDLEGTVREELDIHSPSKAFLALGKYIVDGLAIGIKTTAGTALKNMATLSNRLFVAARDVAKATGRSVNGSINLINSQKKLNAAWSKMAPAKYTDQIVDYYQKTGRTGNRTLADIVRARDDVVFRLNAANARLKTQTTAHADVVKDISSKMKGEFKLGASILTESNPYIPEMRFSDVKTYTTGVLGRLRTFNTKLQQLRKKGVSATLIQEVANLGSIEGSAMADALLSGSAADVKGLNSDVAAIAGISQSIGVSTADGMYKVGIDATKGLVNGLLKDQKSLSQAATTLSNTLITTVKKNLGIRSPSRVFAELGKFTTQGYIVGLDKMQPVLDSRVDSLINVVPRRTTLSMNAPAPIASAPAGVSALGSTSNDPVVIQVLPSAGMDEVAVGRAAVRELNFQMLAR